MVFDGRATAAQITVDLQEKFTGRNFKIVAILDPTNPASVTYTNIKAKKAAELNITFDKIEVDATTDVEKIITKLNKDKSVHGIMLQLPLKGSDYLIELIDPLKDIDGLRLASPYKSAVVKAVRAIFDQAQTEPTARVVIVGAQGSVGQKLMVEFPEALCMDRDDFDEEVLRDADVIISATGQPGLITSEMVQDGVVAIDVGYPKGDFDEAVENKASFFTPVPGGVGPMTVVMLFANLLEKQ